MGQCRSVLSSWAWKLSMCSAGNVILSDFWFRKRSVARLEQDKTSIRKAFGTSSEQVGESGHQAGQEGHCGSQLGSPLPPGGQQWPLWGRLSEAHVWWGWCRWPTCRGCGGGRDSFNSQLKREAKVLWTQRKQNFP